ncbi:VOC family protein [Shewanella dokdonensis]|uniref:VOC family protein n=1 Tax=Shewanella dokdonensis TaxID=712036 RepID=A0ABX8DEX6_9GAMM|nr:VOC family protein [Shewanella dokdonensis]MCL1076080.1 VOC family protein [Shewanella dokdonensis]QVK23191.1 VOC family protein [Shewanella dokdonensis]
MLRVMELDHLVLLCSDIEVMLDFYERVLGATLERQLQQPPLWQLRLGNVLIDLQPREQHDVGVNVEHFCLNIAETDETLVLHHLQRQGVMFEPFSEKYGARGYSRSLYMYDPEDNKVELKILPGSRE